MPDNIIFTMSKKIEIMNKKKSSKEKKTYMSKKTTSSKIFKENPKERRQKRRGRRPKKIIDDSEKISGDGPNNGNQDYNDSAVILRLNIDPTKLKNIKSTSVIPQKKCQIEEETSEGMFRNDIPCDNKCYKCVKNEKLITILRTKLEKYEKKEKAERSNKIYYNKLNFISYITGKKISIKKTNIKCWWDTYTFSNLPCFLPELLQNNTYHVSGCFCSFNCALAYNLYYLRDSKIYHRKSLVYKLYRELYGLGPDDTVDLREAPPREILEDFGGTMTIESFRESFVTINKEYVIYVPPIKPINIIIEEKNIETDGKNNDDGYILKRSKPLAKKRSVISSMKININDSSE
jgi:hypothetical protein